ncbi:MAG: S8 family peptidase [bacterium]
MREKLKPIVLYFFTIVVINLIVSQIYIDHPFAKVYEAGVYHAELGAMEGLYSYNEIALSLAPSSQMINQVAQIILPPGMNAPIKHQSLIGGLSAPFVSTPDPISGMSGYFHGMGGPAILPAQGLAFNSAMPGAFSSIAPILSHGIPGITIGPACNDFLPMEPILLPGISRITEVPTCNTLPPMAPLCLPIMEPAYFPAMKAEMTFLNYMEAGPSGQSTGADFLAEAQIFSTPSPAQGNNNLYKDKEAINLDTDYTNKRSKEYSSIYADEIVITFYPSVSPKHINALLTRFAALGCKEKEKSRMYPSWRSKKHTAILGIESFEKYLHESEIYALKAHLSRGGRHERIYASEILRYALTREYQRLFNSEFLDPLNSIQYIEPALTIPKRKTSAFYPNDIHFQTVPSISNPLFLTRPQWYLDQEHLNLPLAWEDPVNGLLPPYLGTGIVIAVLDTGLSLAPNIRLSGPAPLPAINPLLTDLAGVTISPYFWNFIDNNINIDETPYYNAEGILTSTTHGTLMTGCIAQTINNIIGSAGIAPSVTIMPIKVVGPSGADYTDLANGIYYAVDNGARIINLSLGGPVDSLVEQAAIDYAFNNNVTVVCAAGNNGWTDLARDTPVYPAAYLTTIAVSATDYNNDLAPYSSIGNTATGPNYIPGTSLVAGTAPLDATYTDDDYVSGSTFIIDVCAPGGDIIDENQDGYTDGILAQHIDGSFYSVIIDDLGNQVRYVDLVGTSPACALVSGIVALMIQKDPSLVPNTIKQRLRDTANFATLPASLSLDYTTSVVDPLTGAVTIISTITTYTTIDERELLFGQGLVDAAAAVHFGIIPPVPDPLPLLPNTPPPLFPPFSGGNSR